MSQMRAPAIAGAFYPADPAVLAQQVDALLAAEETPHMAPPKAMIVPHAGLVYSGGVAARAFARLRSVATTIRRVVLVGPAHRIAFQGIALPSQDAFATPLGAVPVDRAAIDQLMSLPQCREIDEAHAKEHCLEIELPFLQRLLGAFSIVPVLAGRTTPQQVAEVLETLWGGPETLILISSDLSHFHDYKTCQRLDEVTRAAIERLDYEGLNGDHACGRLAIGGLLEVARRRGYGIETIQVLNSGDTAGRTDLTRVVGYGAWALTDRSDFASATERLMTTHGADLISLAAKSIVHGLNNGIPLPQTGADQPGALKRRGASFITLKRNGALRGCIGSPEAWRPLNEDIAENAYKAAFSDPRFPPLSRDELDEVELSLSVLSTPEPFTFHSEDEFMEMLRPGEDGVILSEGTKRGLFLPVVWEQLSDARSFTRHLKQKAGLPADYWSPTLTAKRFITRGVDAKAVGGRYALWQLAKS